MIAVILLAGLASVFTATGFEAPESACWDAVSDHWYVSNIAGSPGDPDGEGWISKLDRDGAVVDAKWVTGLDAPKGIAVWNGKLYVADIDEVAILDVERGRVERREKVEGAVFLSDVCIDATGTVYVSDMMGDTIYRMPQGGDSEVFLSTLHLEGPNGLLLDGGDLVVASWGPITDRIMWTTRHPGRLLRVDLQTRRIEPIGKPLGNLDGIARYDGGWVVTDWTAGKVYQVSRNGRSRLLQDGLQNCADLGVDPERALLAIPEMGAGMVRFFDLGTGGVTRK